MHNEGVSTIIVFKTDNNGTKSERCVPFDERTIGRTIFVTHTQGLSDAKWSTMRHSASIHIQGYRGLDALGATDRRESLCDNPRSRTHILQKSIYLVRFMLLKLPLLPKAFLNCHLNYSQNIPINSSTKLKFKYFSRLAFR